MCVVEPAIDQVTEVATVSRAFREQFSVCRNYLVSQACDLSSPQGTLRTEFWLTLGRLSTAAEYLTGRELAGVLIEHLHRLGHPEDLFYDPKASEALQRIRERAREVVRLAGGALRDPCALLDD
jgi:hypothetical protein